MKTTHEIDLQIIENARNAYLSESVEHDPSAVKDSNNLLLLLLRRTKDEISRGGWADNGAGIDAALNVCEELARQSKSRSVRKWIDRYRQALISLASSMARSLESEVIAPVPLALPKYGRFRAEKESVEYPEVFAYRFVFISEPLPDWYFASLLRPPSKATILVDEIARRVLTSQYN
jgi:hypothetical protein